MTYTTKCLIRNEYKIYLFTFSHSHVIVFVLTTILRKILSRKELKKKKLIFS